MNLRAKDETPESADCGIAIDMGASHLRFVLASVQGQILQEARERVHSEAGPHGVIAQIREGISKLIQSKNELGTLRGIAIGVPGGVDPQTGKVVDANNVPGWREEDMGRELEEIFQIPVFLDNDANMAAIGEHWRGAARGIANFVFIALGTGIGAGIFVDGRICRGRNGFAGELFRMNLEWPRWAEDFPDTGYLETYISGVGLAKLGRKVVAHGNGDQPSTLADQRDARYIFEALHQGDAGAHTLIEQSFLMLGVAVANVVTVLDPELIVFNGGLVKGAPDLLLETVGKVVRKMQPKAPKITLSTLGDKAQIWGALHTLLEPAQQCAIRSAQ